MKIFSHLILALLLSVPAFVLGQRTFSGTVIDTYTKLPISKATVTIQGTSLQITTDNSGHFSLTTGIDNQTARDDLIIKVIDNKICWYTDKTIDITIINSIGQETGLSKSSLYGSGEISISDLAAGIYILTVTCNGAHSIFKINKTTHSASSNYNNPFYTQAKEKSSKSSSFDTIIITKTGFYEQKYAFETTDAIYEIMKLDYADIDYLDKIIRFEAYEMLEGMPLNSTFSQVKSIKLIYSIADGKIYYSNAHKYVTHYEFCSGVLGYNKGYNTFNQEQYGNNPNRLYYLACLNHFTASDIYTLEFFPGDEINCEQIKLVYDKVVETFYLGDSLRFYASSIDWSTCSGLPIITSDQLYNGQNFQPLCFQENFGYLKKVDINYVSSTYLSRHDIVLLNGIPIDIPVVAGLITTQFQTPLSHINVLSHNRGTPNMALRDGWTNPKLNNFLDKLVYLQVTADSFRIREATLQEAQAFWAEKEPQTPHILNLDTTTKGLIELSNAGVHSVSLIGGKASNFAELLKADTTDYGPIPLPEGYFAIPFYYYHQHIKKYGLDVFIDSMLNDPQFYTDINRRQKQLEILQDSIKDSPMDTSLLRLVTKHISNTENYTNIRFRSSTNAEDIAGFNGAGLYDSYTGIVNDPKKTIDKAIKKVWASLWNFRAFEEREYFKIDHKTTAMGVLAHRSYPSESANGVVITENIYNPQISAITINVQVDEISVVSPENNYMPDQILFYTYSGEGIIEYINHSNVPGMEGKTVLTVDELKELKEYCLAIHYHYCKLNFECKPMDIEFKVDVVDGKRKIYIKQARLY